MCSIAHPCVGTVYIFPQMTKEKFQYYKTACILASSDDGKNILEYESILSQNFGTKLLVAFLKRGLKQHSSAVHNFMF